MRKLFTICVVALAAVAVSAASAAPDRSGPRVIRSGKCAGPATWKLKLKNDDGRLEVEFEVDQNVVGRRWNVTLKRDGAVVFRGVRVTRAPSGSFSIARRSANPAGADRVVATANAAAGGTCRAALNV